MRMHVCTTGEQRDNPVLLKTLKITAQPPLTHCVCHEHLRSCCRWRHLVSWQALRWLDTRRTQEHHSYDLGMEQCDNCTDCVNTYKHMAFSYMAQ